MINLITDYTNTKQTKNIYENGLIWDKWNLMRENVIENNKYSEYCKWIIIINM